jgi:hypothetical protein
LAFVGLVDADRFECQSVASLLVTARALASAHEHDCGMNALNLWPGPGHGASPDLP